MQALKKAESIPIYIAGISAHFSQLKALIIGSRAIFPHPKPLRVQNSTEWHAAQPKCLV